MAEEQAPKDDGGATEEAPAGPGKGARVARQAATTVAGVAAGTAASFAASQLLDDGPSDAPAAPAAEAAPPAAPHDAPAAPAPEAAPAAAAGAVAPVAHAAAAPVQHDAPVHHAAPEPQHAPVHHDAAPVAHEAAAPAAHEAAAPPVADVAAAGAAAAAAGAAVAAEHGEHQGDGADGDASTDSTDGDDSTDSTTDDATTDDGMTGDGMTGATDDGSATAGMDLDDLVLQVDGPLDVPSADPAVDIGLEAIADPAMSEQEGPLDVLGFGSDGEDPLSVEYGTTGIDDGLGAIDVPHNTGIAGGLGIGLDDFADPAGAPEAAPAWEENTGDTPPPEVLLGLVDGPDSLPGDEMVAPVAEMAPMDDPFDTAMAEEHVEVVEPIEGLSYEISDPNGDG